MHNKVKDQAQSILLFDQYLRNTQKSLMTGCDLEFELGT